MPEKLNMVSSQKIPLPQTGTRTHAHSHAYLTGESDSPIKVTRFNTGVGEGLPVEGNNNAKV